MKTFYTILGFLGLLLFTQNKTNTEPELVIRTNNYEPDYSREIINSKIDTLEYNKHRVILLQKELGYRK